MANSLYERSLQGIMAVVFIIQDAELCVDNVYNVFVTENAVYVWTGGASEEKNLLSFSKISGYMWTGPDRLETLQS